MKKKVVTALVITPSIHLGEGLDALLSAIPQIDEVEVTSSLEKALHKIEAGEPGIVLLDAGLARKNTKEYLEKIALLSPITRRVLLVDDVQDLKWMPKYAEAILIKGVPPSAVATIVTNLLSTKGEENGHSDPNK